MQNELKQKIKKLFQKREFSLLIVLIIICAIIQMRNSNFLTVKVLTNIFVNYSYTMVMSAGMMLVLLIGGIDISTASILAFSGMSASLLMRDGYITNWFVAYLAAALIGAACGFVIGLVVAKGRVLPIIATLGFQYIYRGLTYVISNSRTVVKTELLNDYKGFAKGSVFGINNLIVLTLFVYLLFFFIMKWTKIGRRVYSVGSNAEAARITGIPVDRVKIFVYMVCGTISGLCGAMYTSHYSTSQNQQAVGLEMDVIAACVIGGVSLQGGEGSVVGVFLGAVTISIISKSLSLIGIDPFWQQALKGTIILTAVILNVLTQRSAQNRILSEREV